MIRPPGFRGAAFGGVADGDGRSDPAARAAISKRLGIPAEWAVVRQVHGATVLMADRPGRVGEADALVTTTRGLPIAVGTADCLPVVIEAEDAVALVHAGWRGAAAGVAAAAVAALAAAGAPALRAAVGPGIGPCCFEVGPEVIARLPEHAARTTWGTPSVDLASAVTAQLGDVPVWREKECTMCGAGWHSYRRDKTDDRQVAVAWLPA